jgi:hypothetical protein
MLQKFFDLSSVWSLFGWIALTNIILVGYVLLSGVRVNFKGLYIPVRLEWLMRVFLGHKWCLFIDRFRRKALPHPSPFTGFKGTVGWTGATGYTGEYNPHREEGKSIIDTPLPTSMIPSSITPLRSGPTPLRYGPSQAELRAAYGLDDNITDRSGRAWGQIAGRDSEDSMMSPPDPISPSIFMDHSELMRRMGVLPPTPLYVTLDLKKTHKDRYQILKEKSGNNNVDER